MKFQWVSSVQEFISCPPVVCSSSLVFIALIVEYEHLSRRRSVIAELSKYDDLMAVTSRHPAAHRCFRDHWREFVWMDFCDRLATVSPVFFFRLLGLFSSDNLQLVCWAFTCNSLFYWAVTGHLMGFYCLLWLCIMLSVLLTAGRWSCDRLLWCQRKQTAALSIIAGPPLGLCQDVYVLWKSPCVLMD